MPPMAGITRIPWALLKLWLILVFWLTLPEGGLQEEDPSGILEQSLLPQKSSGFVTQTQMDAVTTASWSLTAEPIGW